MAKQDQSTNKDSAKHINYNEDGKISGTADGWRERLEALYKTLKKYAYACVSFEDSEDLHKARVNNRKLLSLLKVMKQTEESEKLQRSLEKTHKWFGKIRDRDVLIEAFKQRRKTVFDKGHRKMMKSFIRFQKAERKHHRSKLQNKLPKLFGESLEKRWTDFMDSPALSQINEEQVSRYLQGLEEQFDNKRIHFEQWKQGQGMTHPDTLEALHKVRLQVKELLYLLKYADLFNAVDAEKKKRYYDQLQKPLGKINDTRVWIERWNEVGPQELGAHPSEYRRMLNELSEELTVEIGKLHIVRPEIH